MPTYVYKCRECGHEFERVMRISEHERKVHLACPKCRSTNVAQAPAKFQAVTAAKT